MVVVVEVRVVVMVVVIIASMVTRVVEMAKVAVARETMTAYTESGREVEPRASSRLSRGCRSSASESTLLQDFFATRFV